MRAAELKTFHVTVRGAKQTPPVYLPFPGKCPCITYVHYVRGKSMLSLVPSLVLSLVLRLLVRAYYSSTLCLQR